MENTVVASKLEVFVSWLKALWGKIDIKQWAQDIGGSSSEAIHAAVYFGIGFAVGFLFKKYFKFVFFTLLIAAILILVLEYNKVLEIDWKALNVLLGFEPTADVGVFLNTTFDWIKQNLITFISCTVGFLIGYKLG
ncbi:MAG: FUN14 domain-containing protein [bacterium]